MFLACLLLKQLLVIELVETATEVVLNIASRFGEKPLFSVDMVDDAVDNAVKNTVDNAVDDTAEGDIEDEAEKVSRSEGFFG